MIPGLSIRSSASSFFVLKLSGSSDKSHSVFGITHKILWIIERMSSKIEMCSL